MGRRWLISGTVFATGAAVMVVELLGVRLIAPSFGTGMHVWAALISVALAALSIGYFAGGWLADRRPEPRLFFVLVVLGGAGVGAIPLYAPALIPAFLPLGLRGGALLAATVTFFPPLFLLACVSPFAIRISAASLDRVGTTAGRIYAVSTLGSVAGTLVTGFLLAPVFDIVVTLRITAAVVAAIGLLGLADARRGALGGAAIVLLLLLPPAEGPARPGDVVFAGDTPFQRVEVVERDGERWLYLNGCVHTHVSLEPPYRADTSYVAGFEMLPSFRPDARSLLVIGLGGGAMLPLFEPEGYRTTVVEIDPVVVRVARELFRTLPDGVEVHAGDARPFVRRAGRTWDLVALDVCDSDRMPEHLVTVEFFRELKQAIAPGGAMAMNSIGPTGGRSLAAFGATLREVFAHVTGYAVNPGGEITNVIWYASDEPLELPWAFLSTWGGAAVRTEGGEVLTDRWNPVNHWNAAVARRVRMTHDERY